MSLAVHHEVTGPEDGIPVVLSGSIGSDLRMWAPQAASLSKAGYRVVRYDHRGHGASPVPDGPSTMADLGGDVLTLLDSLGIERAHWVGLSLGGMVGMWLAEQVGERLKTLTLLCTSAQLPASAWADRIRTVRAQGMRAIADTTVPRWFTPEWRAANPELVRYYGDMIAGQPVDGYASCCAAIQSMDIEAGLPRILAPTLVISGAEDPATPPEHGRRIAAAVPGARFEIVTPGAHLANVEAAEQVDALILQHLNENA
ncbi:3-oxoadipate enol-lactonase [Nocardia sp. R6R-6]|uniref:3-oxoadipate enol-lactonase n=1 Tax=Nocardia sp. R6R-6 TaxID=3459303 RepID=UPI00403D70A8